MSLKISVLLITYNHENYIRQCLDGICQQQIAFDAELIVADDHSTDATVAIIREYTHKISMPFIFVDASVNIGTVKNYERAFAACNGDYVAVIEGDDYWTDPCRLQKHIDFLEAHQDCVMTMNRMTHFIESKSLHTVEVWHEKKDYYFVTTSEMAMENKLGNLSACVFRKNALNKIKPDLFELKIADWMIGMVLGEYGSIAILKDVMSVYRIHENGQWSKMNHQEQSDFLITLIDTYNKYLGFRYDNEFKGHKNRLLAANQVTHTKSSNTQTLGFIPSVFSRLKKLLLPR
jgi:glycosyltransferase involved in cell wall biosynthesis